MLKLNLLIAVVLIGSSSGFSQQNIELAKLTSEGTIINLSISNSSYMITTNDKYENSNIDESGLILSKHKETEINGKFTTRIRINSFSDYKSLRDKNLNNHISPIYLNEDGREQFASDEIFIVFKESISESEIFDFENKYNIQKIVDERSNWLGERRLYKLKPPFINNSIEVAEIILNEEYVKKSFVNWVYDLNFFNTEVNDEYIDDQWNIEKTYLDRTWDIATGRAEIVIAIVDEGVDLTHDDITLNLFKDGTGNVIGINTTDTGPSNDPNPNGDDAHGTASAGIAAGVTNNGGGIAGACWNCKIMPIQIARSAPFPENWTYASWIISGINYAWNNGAHIISNSWGGLGYDANIEDEFNDAYTAGSILIASSGNYEKPHYIPDVRYPAAFNNVIAVGATKPNDNRKKWDDGDENNWGSCFGIELDIVAPGIFIPTTDISGIDGYSSGDYDLSFNGTSSAAPLVSGTVGLILSVNPNLTPSEVKTILQNSADKVPGMGGLNFTNEYGYGRLNALKAVYKAQRMAVQDQMVNYKSLNEDASGSNSSRRLIYDQPSGTYHVVFASGSEIVYYKRPPWGSPSTPILLTQEQTGPGIGRHFNPNITMDKYGVLHAVWEFQSYGVDPQFGQYISYYSKSTDGGNTWSTETAVSPVSHKPMNPQILSYKAYYDDEMMLVYHYFDYIRARVYNRTTGVWEAWSTGTDVIPNTSTYTREFSAIASSKFNFSNFNVVYKNELDGHLYHNQYNYTTDWGKLKNLSSIVSGSATHHSPSVSNDPSYTTGASPAVHVAWVRTTGSGSGSYDNKVIHRWTTDLNNWPNVYYTPYYQLQLKPSISGIGSTGNYKAHLVWEIQGNGGVAKQYFNGANWSIPTTVTTDGKYPSLSTGGNQARYFYTGEIGPDFDVTLSSETLFKTSGSDQNFYPDDLVYKRSLTFMDSTGAYLEFILHDVEQVNEVGFSNSREMKAINQDEVDLSIPHALKTLNVVSNEIDKSSDLNFKLEIRGNRVSDLFEEAMVPEIKIGNQTLNQYDQRFSADISGLSEAGPSVNNSVSISKTILGQESYVNLVDLESYVNFKEGVFASLGHIIDRKDESFATDHQTLTVTTDLFSEISTFANPNPFNPTTSISFTLPNEAKVVLKVFDVLGREVAELVNGVKTAGSHSVHFDASRLSSGVYFYTIESGNQVITNSITLIK